MFNPKESVMWSTVRSSPLLRRVLAADALVSAASALLMSAGNLPLSALLGLPRPLLLVAGLLLVPYALAVAWMAARRRLPGATVSVVIVANVAWAAACTALLLDALVQPTAAGRGFIVLQVVTVLLFATLQFAGWRRSARGEPARLVAA
jgi:hypothetical protein